VAHAGKELVALQRLLQNLAIDVGSVWKLFNDNVQTPARRYTQYVAQTRARQGHVPSGIYGYRAYAG
jgi:thioesterase domain-containing protein